MILAARQAHPELSIQRLCQLLAVSRSWFYGRPAQPEADPADLALRDAIEASTLAFPGAGDRRVTAALQRAGWRVNHQRVLRVLGEDALRYQLQRRVGLTTDSRHALPRDPNLLGTQAINAPNQAWVADITSIRLPTTFVSLAALLDDYSRYCVGWRLSRSIDTQLTLAALEMALSTRQVAPGLMHHSAQGGQYASDA